MIFIGLISLIVAIKKNFLLIILFQTAFIGLITSQATWFASTAINNIGDIFYLGYSYFGMQDALITMFLFFIFQLALFVIAIYTFKRRSLIYKNNTYGYHKSYRVKKLPEIFIYSVVACMFGPAMILNAGGIGNFIYEPGSMLPGQTFFLLILGILKWNLLNRLIYGIPVTLASILYFVFYLFFCLFTSRFLTVFALLQLMIFWHYYYKPITISQLVKSMGPIVAVILVFGIYRDIAHNSLAKDMEFMDLIAAMFAFLPNFFEWFFTNNTEIFSGVANSLRQLREGAEINLLLPELGVVFYLLPNFIRTDDNLIFKNLLEYMNSSGTQSGSVIASGFERFVMGLDLFGFAIYGILLLWFLYSAEVALRDSRKSFMTIASIQAVNGLRGSLPGVLLFFGLADFLASKVFRICLIQRIRNMPKKV
jgi:hypothetical protein